MSEEVKDSQKTVVAFIAGLLVGALLVWMFGSSDADMKQDMHDADDESALLDEDMMEFDSESEADTAMNEEVDAILAAELPVGDAEAELGGTTAGSVVNLSSATFPTDAGWVAVRSYNDGMLGNVLGASRYSKEQGLVPETIQLLTPTIVGQEYAIVFFSENGDRQFNMRSDFQLDVDPIVFTAE